MIGSDLSKAVLSSSVRQVRVVIQGIRGRRMHIDETTHSARVLQFAKLVKAMNEASSLVSFDLQGDDGPEAITCTFTWTIDMDIDRLPAIIKALEETPLQAMWPW